MAIYKNNKITIDLTELVEIRAQVTNQELSEYEVEQIASALQHTLTWDTLFFMVDSAILDFVGMNPIEYGSTMNESWLLEIERNKKCFKMVELKGNSWTIEVPRRVKE
tara:strand:- start:393 stop:716 length:324 start_codon:yes stop_codon:yes gene_type:complete